MTVSDIVRGMLKNAGKKSSDLAEEFGVSRGAVNNKMYRSTWTAQELAHVVKFTGGHLYAEYPNGSIITIDVDYEKKKVPVSTRGKKDTDHGIQPEIENNPELPAENLDKTPSPEGAAVTEAPSIPEEKPQDAGPEEVYSMETDDSCEDTPKDSETQAMPKSPAEEATPTELTVVDYTEAKLPLTDMELEDFLAPANKDELSERIKTIMEAEGPIAEDRIIRKILQSFGVSFKARQAKDKIADIAQRSIGVKKTGVGGNRFYWNQDQDPKTYSVIRRNAGVALRVEEIPPRELANAICYILKRDGRMKLDELMTKMRDLFGYKRLSEQQKKSLERNGLGYAKREKRVSTDGRDRNKIVSLV